MMDFEVCLTNGDNVFKKIVKNASLCNYHEDTTYINNAQGETLFQAPHSSVIYVMKIDKEHEAERK
ncbi:hypothetical protein PVJ1_00078 [Psychrobacillus phage PVJ1]|nr:hypothetical protein PVJ1_00078 [Psychrobacillus phage PVJ1]